MYRSNILIPLTSRRVSPQKREESERTMALIGETDRKYIRDIRLGLYSLEFDVYLGGAIIEAIFTDWSTSYERVDIVAQAQNKDVRKSLTNRLRRAKNETGSDAWIHFGMIVQRQEGWKIKDFYRGSMFYADEISTSPRHTEFKLTPAIYVMQKREPSPIHLHIRDTLEEYNIL